MERLVEVSDQEVRIDFVLGCKCRANVSLRSLSSTSPIAFKVQTSSPHKFLVNPPGGLILPSSIATFQIILKPQTQLPSSFPRSPSDRFLIKTALAPEFSVNPSDPTTNPESINSWFSSHTHVATHDLKLKVAYVGVFLLHRAVSGGDIEVVKNIIKRQKSVIAELSPRDADSLFRAATESSNSNDMTNLLVEAGLQTTDARAQLDNMDAEGESRWMSKGWTRIHVAAAFDRTDELHGLIEEATEGGGSLDCRDKEGRTPLHLAASRGNVRCAQLLVEAGADKNAKSHDGRTALYRAAANGAHQMVGLLMKIGADPTIATAARGRSPIDVARDKGHNEVVEILEQGDSVLTAARRGELRDLESLLGKGASTKCHDQYGLTALHSAAIKGHKDAVCMLIEYGTDMECQDIEGHTPLHLAVEGGSIETVEALINKGANVNARSRRGATPLYMAEAMGYEDISQMLLKSGASSSSQAHSSSLSSMS